MDHTATFDGARLRTEIPAEWQTVADAVLTAAREKALDALEGPAPQRLVEYYDVSGDYVGAALSELTPIDADDMTAADLHAVSLMNVDIGPRATRRILQGPERQWVLAELRRLPNRALHN